MNFKLVSVYFEGYQWYNPWPHLGPWIWAPRKLGTKKFIQGPKFLRPKLLRAQISWGQNFSGMEFLGDQKSQGTKFLGDQISWGQNEVSYFELNPLVLLAIKFRLMFSCENAFDSRLRQRKKEKECHINYLIFYFLAK